MPAPIMHLLGRLRALPAQWLDAEVTEHAAEQREAWIASGWLQPLPPAAHAACPRCPDGATGPVRMLINRMTGLPTAQVACAQCGLAEVPMDSLRRWRIDLGKFVADLARALSSCAEPRAWIEERAWLLGRAAWAGRSREFIFVVAVDSASHAHGAPVLDRHPKAVVLVPTVDELAAANWFGNRAVIALSEVLAVREGKLQIDRERVETILREAEPVASGSGKKAPVKRASRAGMIERVIQELIAHLRAAKSHAHAHLQRYGEPALLPRPTKKQLGIQAGLRPDDVTRCFKDGSAQQLRVLWEVADDLEQILKFGGGIAD